MLKFFFIIFFSIVVVQCQFKDFPISGGCKALNSFCLSGSQCCSGSCQNVKCINVCKKILQTCNQLNEICCPGTQCRQSDQRCCRLSGQDSLTPSECCNQEKWKGKTNLPGGRCCSEHAQTCQDTSDCCGLAKCQSTPSTSVPICI